MIGYNLKDGKWNLVKFVEEHTHVLATPKENTSYPLIEMYRILKRNQ